MKVNFSNKEKARSLIDVTLFLVISIYILQYLLRHKESYPDVYIVALVVVILLAFVKLYAVFRWPKLSIDNNKIYIYKPGWKFSLRKAFSLDKIKKVIFVNRSDGFGSFQVNNTLTIEVGSFTESQRKSLLSGLVQLNVEVENKVT